MDKKQRHSLSLLGVSTLMVLFALLCLLVFGLLALSTARSDARLTDSALNTITDYYAADTAAEEIFACLRAGEFPPGVSREGTKYSYSCPISRGQSLEVTLEQQGDTWTVLRWQTVSRSITGG